MCVFGVFVVVTGWLCMGRGGWEVQLQPWYDLVYVHGERKRTERKTDFKKELMNQTEGQR